MAYYTNHSATCFFTQHCIHFNCSIEFHCMNIPSFIHSPSDGHLGCFRFFTLTNNAIKKPRTHLLGYTFESLAGAAEYTHLHLAKLLSKVMAPIYTSSSRV